MTGSILKTLAVCRYGPVFGAVMLSNPMLTVSAIGFCAALARSSIEVAVVCCAEAPVP